MTIEQIRITRSELVKRPVATLAEIVQLVADARGDALDAESAKIFESFLRYFDKAARAAALTAVAVAGKRSMSLREFKRARAQARKRLALLLT